MIISRFYAYLFCVFATLAVLSPTFAGDLHRPPLVLVPGGVGGRLVDQNGSEIWPGGVEKVLLSEYRDLALEFDPATLEVLDDELRVSGITDTIAGQDFYGRIRELLTDEGGYELTQVGSTPGTKPAYYEFEYDWRQDYIQTAGKLHQFLEQIRRDHAQPDLAVDIIAHSAGGLIVRYFSRFGSQDITSAEDTVLVSGDGADYVRKVLMLGVPIQGSVPVMMYMVEGAKIGLVRIPPEILATWPGVYQSWPHPEFNWLVNEKGLPLFHDLYDVATWEKLGISIFDEKIEARIRSAHDDDALADRAVIDLQRFFESNVRRAEQFLTALSIPTNLVSVEYITLGSDCVMTPSKAILEQNRNTYRLVVDPDSLKKRSRRLNYEQLILSPGDGTVTRFAQFPMRPGNLGNLKAEFSDLFVSDSLFICESHTKLASNRIFQEKLLRVLRSN